MKSQQDLVINQGNHLYKRDKCNYSAGELALLGFIPMGSLLYPKQLMDNPPDWYFTAIVGDNSLKLITANHGYAHFIDECLSVYRIGVKDSVMDTWRKENNKDKQIHINKGFFEII